MAASSCASATPSPPSPRSSICLQANLSANALSSRSNDASRALLISPDANLLIVESVPRTPPAHRPKTPLFGPTPSSPPADASDDPTPVQINFYRISAPNDASERDTIPRSLASAIPADTGSIATTAAGYLDIIDQGRQHWAFDFDSYAGRRTSSPPSTPPAVPCRSSSAEANSSPSVAAPARPDS